MSWSPMGNWLIWVNSAAEPSTTDAVIDQQTTSLGLLSKDGLVAVAEGIQLMGMKAKTKDAIVAAIRQRIRARRGATERAGLIDRPVAGNQSSVEMFAG